MGAFPECVMDPVAMGLPSWHVEASKKRKRGLWKCSMALAELRLSLPQQVLIGGLPGNRFMLSTGCACDDCTGRLPSRILQEQLSSLPSFPASSSGGIQLLGKGVFIFLSLPPGLQDA